MDDYKRNKTWIGQNCLTNSKHENSHIRGIYPKTVIAGTNATLIARDGANYKRYIDFICGLGTNLFGYGNNKICDAINRSIRNGISHSLPTHYEGLAAEKLSMLFPWVEKYKFICTGSQACSAAVKMARAYTGRYIALSEGYHGHDDMFVSLTPPANGIPPHPHMAKLTNLSDITEHVAAVIVEPIITDNSVERIQWLADLRQKCTETGTVLIFDEVITGFRYLNYSVSQNYKIRPDLMCLGKAIGSGIPLAAVCGRSDILDGNYFVSSTNAGNVAGLAACIAGVELLTGSPDYNIERLWESGQYFINKFNEMHDGIKLEGYPTRGSFVGDPMVKALFFQECCRGGVMFGPSWFFNFDHLSDMDFVLETCESVLNRINRGEIKLEGMMPESAFAAKVRENK